jgi:ADP-ribosylarginine hydrolase
MDDKYISCMIMHAVGDTVGFKNGEWEFKKGDFEKTLEKLYEFIDLGGIIDISLKGWRVSDDTIMHIQTTAALLENYNNINTLGNILKKNFIDALNQFEKEGLEIRYPGESTMRALKRFRDGADWNEIPYNINAGGSGASMRSLCIGLAFNGKENRHKLIQIAIESGRMTNNSAVGYLGALASALFTALAIERIKINDWPFTLLDLFKSGIISKYMSSVDREVEQYERDHHIFIEKWHRYIENKFDDKKNPIRRRADKNLVYRGKYYYDNFGFKKQTTPNKLYEDAKQTAFIGSGGDDSVIIAYDCLIDSGESWEKLVIYSMLHMGDTDTTGAIAAGLYGVLYGIQNVPKNFLEHLEYKKELTDLGRKLYKKYHKK